MFEKLGEVDKRYREMEQQLYDPAVIADVTRYQTLLKEQTSLRPLVETYRRYQAAEAAAAEARQWLDMPGSDPEWHSLAQSQWDEARKTIAHCTEELKLLLLPQDPNDRRSVVVEIRAGAGGEESALFAAALYRMYTMYAQRHGFQTEPVSQNQTELGGYREISFLVTGDGAYSCLKYESGVHRVQRVPETESGGRIHTSTATVAVLPEAEEVDLQIASGDLQIDTFRASGAGGQHINKTESAIRITHLPTGTVVECQDERSQYKNKEKAMRVLRSRLMEGQRAAQAAQTAADRKAQVGTGDRSERIRTYNFPQGRVTDHRIGLTLYRLSEVMDGDLDEIVDALTAAYRAEQLKASGETL